MMKVVAASNDGKMRIDRLPRMPAKDGSVTATMQYCAAAAAWGGPMRFLAFISYAHRDARQAHWLHRAIETYLDCRVG